MSEEIKRWVDWGIKGMLTSLLTFAVSYLRTISQDLNSMSIAIVEIRGENHRTADKVDSQSLQMKTRMDFLSARIERVESFIIFKKP